MKTLLTHLTRFAVFNAVMFAVFFGLPALAEHHPFILLVISLAVLILAVYAIHKPAAKPKATKHRTATHRNTFQHRPHKAA